MMWMLHAISMHARPVPLAPVFNSHNGSDPTKCYCLRGLWCFLTNADFADLLLWLGRACSGLTECCIDAAVAAADVNCHAVVPLVDATAAVPSPVFTAAVGLAADGPAGQ
jgi:hypothetical protein